jgi:glutathione S-transferase
MHLMLEPMELALQNHAFLMGAKLSWVDIAIFPFIRQFSMVNPQEFEGMPISKVKAWLEQRITSPLFQAVMDKHPTWLD